MTGRHVSSSRVTRLQPRLNTHLATPSTCPPVNMTVFTHSSFPPCSPARVQSLRPCQNQILASFIIQRSTNTLTSPVSEEMILTLFRLIINIFWFYNVQCIFMFRFPVNMMTKINTRSIHVGRLSPVVEVQSAMFPPLSMNLLVISLTSSMTAILTPSRRT